MKKEQIKKELINYIVFLYGKSAIDTYEYSIDKYLQSLETEKEEMKQCPSCGSENLFDICMHHYKCKDCEEKWTD